MSETTYYEKNRDVILNRAKDYYKNKKERLRDNARDKYIIFLKKKKMKGQNMEKIDIIICLKKRNKNLKNTKKVIVKLIKAENLNLIKKCMTISISSFSFCRTFFLFLYALF